METLPDKLNRLLEDESRAKEILKINPNTFRDIAAHIKSIRAESSERDRSLSAEISYAERSILFSIAKRLIELRIAKFRQDPEGDVANLTLQERFIVDPLIQSKKRADRVGQAILNGQLSELEHMGEAVRQKYVVARFLQPYTAISGTDLSAYGPFEPEDVAIMPIENAKNLAKMGIISDKWVEPES